MTPEERANLRTMAQDTCELNAFWEVEVIGLLDALDKAEAANARLRAQKRTLCAFLKGYRQTLRKTIERFARLRAISDRRGKALVRLGKIAGRCPPGADDCPHYDWGRNRSGFDYGGRQCWPCKLKYALGVECAEQKSE